MTNTQIKAKALIDDFAPVTKKDVERLATAKAYFALDCLRVATGGNADSGLVGKIAEILGHDSKSTITKVQKQGATDLYIIIDGKRTKCEYKTNGGRIESLYRLRKPESVYIVYELDFTPADRTRKDGTIVKGERRYIKKILNVADFLELVESCKAVKIASHNGKNDAERAVQCSSKKLYMALLNGGYKDYDRNTTYTSFEI